MIEQEDDNPEMDSPILMALKYPLIWGFLGKYFDSKTFPRFVQFSLYGIKEAAAGSNQDIKLIPKKFQPSPAPIRSSAPGSAGWYQPFWGSIEKWFVGVTIEEHFEPSAKIILDHRAGKTQAMPREK